MKTLHRVGKLLVLAGIVLALAGAGTVSAGGVKPPVKAKKTPSPYNYCLDTRPATCVILPERLGQRVDDLFKVKRVGVTR